MPVSHPRGEPLVLQPVAPAVGDVETVSFTSHKLLEIKGAKHQKNEQRARVRVKILAVDGDHATKLEVTTQEAIGSTQVETNRDESALLEGVYIVSQDAAGALSAAREDGTGAAPGDQDSLGVLVGDRLSRDDGTQMLIDHPLRVGESVPVELDLAHEMYNRPAQTHAMLSLVSADATSATYQIDFAATANEPNLVGDIDLKGRRTLIVDRAKGRITTETLMTYKTERRTDRSVDELSEQSLTRQP